MSEAVWRRVSFQPFVGSISAKVDLAGARSLSRWSPFLLAPASTLVLGFGLIMSPLAFNVPPIWGGVGLVVALASSATLFGGGIIAINAYKKLILEWCAYKGEDLAYCRELLPFVATVWATLAAHLLAVLVAAIQIWPLLNI